MGWYGVQVGTEGYKKSAQYLVKQLRGIAAYIEAHRPDLVAEVTMLTGDRGSMPVSCMALLSLHASHSL